MDINNLLPIGTVVMLDGGQKRVMIYGVKQTNQDDGKEYDYIGVVYPEGNMGQGTQFLFNHEQIDKIYYRGYEDKEREDFIKALADYYSGKRV
jgi:hypothetical protein